MIKKGSYDAVIDDNIGETSYSKTWLLKLLMRVLREVKENISLENDECHELSEDLEEELCIFWDITASLSILEHLEEFDPIDIFMDVLASSQSPRLSEIALGIMANLAYGDYFASQMSENAGFIQRVLSQLHSRDSQTLNETCRLLQTVIASEEFRDPWVAALHFREDVLDNLVYILSFSSNTMLLLNCGRLVEVITRENDAIAEIWCTSKLFDAISKALVELLNASSMTEIGPLHRLLYTFSTNITGVQTLLDHTESTLMHVNTILMRIASEESALMIDLIHWHNSLRALIPVCILYLNNLKAQEVFLHFGKIPTLTSCLVDLTQACLVQMKATSSNDADTTLSGLWLDLRNFFRCFIDITCSSVLNGQHEIAWLCDIENGPDLETKRKFRTNDTKVDSSSSEDEFEKSMLNKSSVSVGAANSKEASNKIDSGSRRNAFIACYLDNDTCGILKKDLLQLCLKLNMPNLVESLNDVA